MEKKAKNVQIIILIFIIPNAGFLEMKIFLFVFVYDFVNMTPLRVLKHINIMWNASDVIHRFIYQINNIWC